MAKIETRYRCPACHRSWSKRAEANNCCPITEELWAIGSGGKGILIGSLRGRTVEQALIEADLSDNIKQRKQQIEERLQADSDFCKKYGIYN